MIYNPLNYILWLLLRRFQLSIRNNEPISTETVTEAIAAAASTRSDKAERRTVRRQQWHASYANARGTGRFPHLLTPSVRVYWALSLQRDTKVNRRFPGRVCFMSRRQKELMRQCVWLWKEEKGDWCSTANVWLGSGLYANARGFAVSNAVSRRNVTIYTFFLVIRI